MHSNEVNATFSIFVAVKRIEYFVTVPSLTRGSINDPTFNTLNASANLFVLGETLRPLLTHAMGSSIEIFDTTGPANSGPPTHFHPWEEIYVVLSGELEVIVEGRSETIAKGAVVHIPANTRHGYRNTSDDCHFLTIVTQGNAAQFFAEAAADVQMSPPDIPAIVPVAKTHGIEFVL